MTIQTTIIFNQQTKMNRTYKNNVGLELVFDVGIKDITSSKIFYQKPDGTTGYWVGEPVVGTNEIKYVIQEGDLDQAGEYKLQPYVDFGSWKGRGSIVSLTVEDILF